ncbi:hypothetical protein ACRJ4W_24190 [Streptomyces sp. GLT-R25]
MPSAEGLRALYGVQQRGQQPGHRLRGAPGQQPSRLLVAPFRPHPVDEPVRQRGAPARDNSTQQLPAYRLGRIDERRLVGGVRHLETVGGAQGVPAHEGVRIGDARRDPLGVPCDGRGDGSEPPLVGAARFELVQQRARLLQFPCASGEFTHAQGVRKWVEGVQQALGLVPRGVDHGVDCACRGPWCAPNCR